MSKCDFCKYPYDIRKWPCKDCLQGDRYEPKPPTNADHIRSMSDEELAAWIAEHPVVAAYDNNNQQHRRWLDWLKQETEKGE